MTSADPPVPAERAPEVELKHGAISFLDALVIGLASTSPAYSLAAVIGPIVALVGIYAPGVLLASFVPMLLIASAFYYLNRVDQDCGTTFSWVTRAMGPWFGWIGGWAIAMTGVLVVGSLADIGVRFSLLTVGLDAPAEDNALVAPWRSALICHDLGLRVGTEHRPPGCRTCSSSGRSSRCWCSPSWRRRAVAVQLARGAHPVDHLAQPVRRRRATLTAGLLLGVFAYWGWESAVNLTEETEDSRGPGPGRDLSTVILVGTYVSVAFAVVAYAGTEFLTENGGRGGVRLRGPGRPGARRLGLGGAGLGGDLGARLDPDHDHPGVPDRLVMARRAALPRVRQIHPRFQTPDVRPGGSPASPSPGTSLAQISENALFDSLTALSLLIAFYYALTGLACAIYYRRQLLESLKNLLLIGVGPVIGASALLAAGPLGPIDMSRTPRTRTAGRPGSAWDRRWSSASASR